MTDGSLSEDIGTEANPDGSDDATGTGEQTFTPGEIKVDEKPEVEVAQGMGSTDEPSEGEGVDEELPEDISVESFKPLLNSLINVPGLYFGAWWARTPEQTDIFATELHIYCQKKGINIRDYIFDELPLIMVGAQLAGGIWNDYKAEKNKTKKESTEEVDKDRLEGEKEEVNE